MRSDRRDGRRGNCGCDLVAARDIVRSHEVGDLIRGERVAENPQFIHGTVEGVEGVLFEADLDGRAVVEQVNFSNALGKIAAGEFDAIKVAGKGWSRFIGAIPNPGNMMPGTQGDGRGGLEFHDVGVGGNFGFLVDLEIVVAHERGEAGGRASPACIEAEGEGEFVWMPQSARTKLCSLASR